MQAGQADHTRHDVLPWAQNLYAESVDNKDAAGFAAAFTSDAWLQFANAPRIVGRDAIEAAIAQFFASFRDLRHESKGTWLQGDTLILEAVVTYTRHDGQRVSVPAVTILRLASGAASNSPLADQCRIYVDLTPLYAVAGPA
ncbi:MAG: nuclear transport factor 2 family protein [Gemmatimonadaceae bacterium]